MTQYFQGGGRSRSSGAARTTFTPPESPFADVAARDTWSAANLDMLFNNMSQYTLIEVVGVGSEQWSGLDTPSSYNSSGWVTSVADLSPAIIKQRYESNSDTNALVDEKESVLDVLSLNNNRLVSSMSVEVPPGTIYIGQETSLSASIRALHARSNVTGNNALLIAQIFDTTNGFSRSFVYEGDAPDTINLNDPVGTATSDTADFSITTTADELLTEFRITTSRSENDVVSFVLQIRTGSDSGPLAVNFTGDVTIGAGGVGTLDLLNTMVNDVTPILVDSGTELFVHAECDGMIGVQVDPTTFVPNAEVDRIIVTRRNIALLNDLATVATSGSYNDLSDQPTIPTPIPARTNEEIIDLIGATIVDGTNINVAFDDASDTVTINSLVTTRTDEDIRDVVGATLVAGMNVTIAVDDDANTITINSTGGSGGGTPPPATADIIYYGLSSTNNPATIDVSTLTTENNPTNPDTISTGATTQGDFFILLVPMDDDLSSIFSTGLSADVTNIFTATDNVRMLNSEQYKSYVLGPLNAGANEQYVINF